MVTFKIKCYNSKGALVDTGHTYESDSPDVTVTERRKVLQHMKMFVSSSIESVELELAQ